MLVEARNILLIVQARPEGETLYSEREDFRNLLDGTGSIPFFVNPRTDPRKMWEDPKKLLKGVSGTIFTGSLDLNIPNETADLRFHMDKVIPLAQAVLEDEMPSMGICFGHQTLITTGGGLVEQIPALLERGRVPVYLKEAGVTDEVLEGLPNPFNMLFNHKDSATRLPSGAVILGRTDMDPHSIVRMGNVVTLQGHPELTDANRIQHGVHLTHPREAPDQTDLIVIRHARRVGQRRPLPAVA